VGIGKTLGASHGMRSDEIYTLQLIIHI